MAARLKLNGGPLPFIWNISARVGPGSDNPNLPTDVELLKVLLVMALNDPAIARFGLKGNSIRPERGGTFDTVLGFWIFRFQQLGNTLAATALPRQRGAPSSRRTRLG